LCNVRQVDIIIERKKKKKKKKKKRRRKRNPLFRSNVHGLINLNEINYS